MWYMLVASLIPSKWCAYSLLSQLGKSCVYNRGEALGCTESISHQEV